MKNSKPTQNVSTIITEQIIYSLESGIIPWTFTTTKPYNANSGREYTGLNRFLLAGAVQKFNDPRFLTFNEIKNLGGQILKDEPGNLTFFASNGNQDIKVETLEQQCIRCQHGQKCKLSDEKKEWQMQQALKGSEAEICGDYQSKPAFISKYYKIWNIQQTTLKDNERFEKLSEPATEQVIKVDDYLHALESMGMGIDLVTKNSGYNPTIDRISVLPKKSFQSPNLFYAHLLRLMGLACGHEKRLNLPYLRDAADIYDYGTIVSEMVAVIMCEQCGISLNFKRSADYIAGLVSVLKKDSRFIIMAGNSANRIVNYLHEMKSKLVAHKAA